MPLTSSAAEAQRVTEQTYDLTALIPSTCNFSLELAVAHFRPIEIGGPPIRAELLTSSSVQKLDGFRVWFGDWAVSAWLDEAADVAELCQFLAQKNDLPTPAEPSPPVRRVYRSQLMMTRNSIIRMTSSSLRRNSRSASVYLSTIP